ncbi:MAG: phosphate ABC transporter substrate-binding protein PstS [Actinobacteria bacterium]|nr:phosphate ABC transporter substrate-binding protein PstS [Actinomycetota bacterium]
MRLALIALLVLACAYAPTAGADVSLSGAGSTLVAPLVTRWASAYNQTAGVQVNYDAIGSGGGIAEISARTVDFGASDAPLTQDQFTLAAGVVQIPWALSATSIPYNLPGLNGRLQLTGQLLAQIYLGEITQWNDPRISAVNPGLTLPSLHITPVYRSDASGTTYNFTDYLSHASAEWKQRIGTSTAVEFPTGVPAAHSSGVADALGSTLGAIGYVEVAYSLTNHLQFAAIQNRAKAFTLPGLRSIAAAAATITIVPSGNALSIVDPPATQRLAYPISTFTYVIAPTHSDKASAIRKFIFWALTQGQKLGASLYFSPIPKPVLVASEKTLDQIGM